MVDIDRLFEGRTLGWGGFRSLGNGYLRCDEVEVVGICKIRDVLSVRVFSRPSGTRVKVVA